MQKDEIKNVKPLLQQHNVVRSVYYTPTIEEFHLGFEYEICSNDHADIWEKCIFDGTERFDVIESQINLFRVKILDKEDIESIGITLSQIEGDSYEWEWKLKDKNGVGIGSFNDDCNNNIELYGCNFRIKNKCELKIVLRQLGVVVQS